MTYRHSSPRMVSRASLPTPHSLAEAGGEPTGTLDHYEQRLQRARQREAHRRDVQLEQEALPPLTRAGSDRAQRFYQERLKRVCAQEHRGPGHEATIADAAPMPPSPEVAKAELRQLEA